MGFSSYAESATVLSVDNCSYTATCRRTGTDQTVRYSHRVVEADFVSTCLFAITQ